MSTMHRLLMIASLLGVVTFFLPFAWSTSGLMAIRDGLLWRLAVPFLVPFVAVAARMVQLQRGELSAGVRRAIYVWSVATICVTLSLYLPGENTSLPSGLSDWVAYLLPLAVVVLGTLVLLRARKSPESESRRQFLALRVAYLPNASVCLFSFIPGDANIGAYLALVTTVIYAADVVLAATERPLQLGRISPA